ncbi:hypothetical protein RO3G_17420 [Rhizopus delemar RA 99-880]|uniref:Uncharacterized protein n=1 Tax=Rhizopus delemar (strain RA 99-880 / ATCC MYA-4621 / FGSC 9543 / NRRL 43880) TaxID=246409 RepID=I1CW78_RHIO9|nr:hypothetical protein RO3G_17420 [Rhizopus delemar RA 99-880]|eukprot:EIE92708.1 hypothetical protein RO3G_17420 [Rhizopus delemar RA 99-880]
MTLCLRDTAFQMVYVTKVADIWRRCNTDFHFCAPVLSATPSLQSTFNRMINI